LAKAKLKETVYDHNLTDEERKELGFSLSEEKYRRVVSEDGALADLFRLYFHRGDWAKAKEYLKRIKNKIYKREIFFTILGGCIIESEEEERWRQKVAEYFRDAFEVD
jgi:ATP/maltotriose-dependent transcriptional regulator MalT